MNLILLQDSDFVSTIASPFDSTAIVRIGGRRARHVIDIHRAEPGRELNVGLLGGNLGKGQVREISSTEVELEVDLNMPPPAPLPVHIVLALPRPKFLKRTLANLTSLGVKRIDLTHAFKVEKSYWHCEQIQTESIRAACLIGLEQARDTHLPTVHLHRRLKPFVEDELPALALGRRAFIAEVSADRDAPGPLREALSLAIGPEGGWVPFEIDLFHKAGFQPVRLGERALTVETAIPTLIGRLAAFPIAKTND